MQKRNLNKFSQEKMICVDHNLLVFALESDNFVIGSTEHCLDFYVKKET